MYRDDLEAARARIQSLEARTDPDDAVREYVAKLEADRVHWRAQKRRGRVFLCLKMIFASLVIWANSLFQASSHGMPKTIFGWIGILLVPSIASGLLAFAVWYSNRGALSDLERKADERLRDADLKLSELRAFGTTAKVRVEIDAAIENDEMDEALTTNEVARRA